MERDNFKLAKQQETQVLDSLAMVDKPLYEGMMPRPHLIHDVFVFGMHKFQVALEARRAIRKGKRI